MAELRWGAATDEGQVRDQNEDAFVAEPLVFGVADGMGGHQAGEIASAVASNTLRDRLGEGADSIDLVVAAVLEANASIFQAAHANAAQRGMGTTLTALIVLRAHDDVPERLALVNVGDSRTYLHRNGTLERATVDHSYVQELVATGHITEAEARTHPRRNIVTRALGIEPTIRVDSWELPLVRGDRFILCSDGLVDEVPDHEIAAIASGIEEPQRAAEELVAMANRHGGRDNVTVVVVDVIGGLDPAAVVPAAIATGDADDTDDATMPMPRADASTTTTITTAVPAVAAAIPKRRRLSVGTFLFLLALALIVTVTVTLVAVVVSNDDDAPSPTTPIEATTTTTPLTTTTEATERTTVPRTVVTTIAPPTPSSSP